MIPVKPIIAVSVIAILGTCAVVGGGVSDAEIGGEPGRGGSPMDEKHYSQAGAEGIKEGWVLSGMRYNCNQCQVPQATDVAPLVYISFADCYAKGFAGAARVSDRGIFHPGRSRTPGCGKRRQRRVAARRGQPGQRALPWMAAHDLPRLSRYLLAKGHKAGGKSAPSY